MSEELNLSRRPHNMQHHQNLHTSKNFQIDKTSSKILFHIETHQI